MSGTCWWFLRNRRHPRAAYPPSKAAPAPFHHHRSMVSCDGCTVDAAGRILHPTQWLAIAGSRCSQLPTQHLPANLLQWPAGLVSHLFSVILLYPCYTSSAMSSWYLCSQLIPPHPLPPKARSPVSSRQAACCAVMLRSAATRCSGPFGATKPSGPGISQLSKTHDAEFTVDAIAQTPAQYWGGDAGTVCNTVLMKPIMTCGDGCLADNR